MPAVVKITALSESSIRRGMRNGTFPACKRLGPRAIGWPESVIKAWVAGTAVASASPGGRPTGPSS
ncbi:helix-turn-helix transcriptional regulator [Stenotrophomonas maltophilia]|uniref:helix-turn-helix transcriptional regulator n=1 Tax=Stenotrophomonas maltophilia TaxID=40324 RepID=UPI003896E7A4